MSDKIRTAWVVVGADGSLWGIYNSPGEAKVGADILHGGRVVHVTMTDDVVAWLRGEALQAWNDASTEESNRRINNLAGEALAMEYAADHLEKLKGNDHERNVST